MGCQKLCPQSPSESNYTPTSVRIDRCQSDNTTGQIYCIQFECHGQNTNDWYATEFCVWELGFHGRGRVFSLQLGWWHFGIAVLSRHPNIQRLGVLCSLPVFIGPSSGNFPLLRPHWPVNIFWSWLFVHIPVPDKDDVVVSVRPFSAHRIVSSIQELCYHQILHWTRSDHPVRHL